MSHRKMGKHRVWYKECSGNHRRTDVCRKDREVRTQGWKERLGGDNPGVRARIRPLRKDLVSLSPGPWLDRVQDDRNNGTLKGLRFCLLLEFGEETTWQVPKPTSIAAGECGSTVHITRAGMEWSPPEPHRLIGRSGSPLPTLWESRRTER